MPKFSNYIINSCATFFPLQTISETLISAQKTDKAKCKKRNKRKLLPKVSHNFRHNFFLLFCSSKMLNCKMCNAWKKYYICMYVCAHINFTLRNIQNLWQFYKSCWTEENSNNDEQKLTNGTKRLKYITTG